MPRHISIPGDAAELLKRLNAAGHAAYAVGGCVRDSLLGQVPEDWDICTSALPEETMNVFSDLRCIPTGFAYGTVTVLYRDAAYEITTFRQELGYSDSRHPDGVRFLEKLEGDLSRRDFTVNAMAADQNGLVTDLFGGQEDLKQGLIRCVGQPDVRFAEDALRMLRALRFASRLGFCLDENTAEAIHRCKESLLQVAPERLRKEMSGLFCGKNAAEILSEYRDVLFLLIPELKDSDGFRQYNFHHALDVWQHSLLTFRSIPPVETLRWAALLHDIGKPSCFSMDKQLIGHFYGHARLSAAYARRILRRLRFDGASIQNICALISAHDTPIMPRPRENCSREKRLRRLLGQLGQEQLFALLELKRADRLGKGNVEPALVEAQTEELRTLLHQIIAQNLCVRQDQLQINGRDLMALGMSPGPQMGLLLKTMLNAVIEGTLPNETSHLVAFAQKHISLEQKY